MRISIDLEFLRNYLIPITTLFVVLALVILVVIPQLNQIASSSLVINQNESRLKTLEVKVEKLKDLEGNKDELQEQLTTAESIIPITKAIAPLVLGVQQIAIANQLEVDSVKLQPGKVSTSEQSTLATNPTEEFTSTSNEVVFQMKVEGNLASLNNFLTILERGRRLMLLKKFTLQQVTNGAYAVDLFFSAPFSPLPSLNSDQLASALTNFTSSDQEYLATLSSYFSNNVTTTNIQSGPVGTTNPFQ